MSKIRVNYKSDLPPVAVKFRINGSVVDVPDHDFIIRFFVDGAPGTSFECAHKGDEYINCAKTAADTLTCYINNHKFGCGRLCCEFIDLSADSRYSDKVLKTVTPSCLDVVLVEGVGDDNIEILNIIFGYEINEIASITAEESLEDGGTNVITIAETNGEELSFNVKNGHKGNGIVSIATEESSVSDGYNIITITDTNGTETEFRVKNGADGVVLEGDPATYIADDLETDDSEMILSAKQGVVLKGLVEDLSNLKAALLDTDDVEDIPVEIIDPNVVRFNDPVAEAIALENWDTNHDGKITLDEAAEVTDYSTLFKGEDIITTEWMGSFPNVTSIGSTSAFQQCLELTNIVIPSNITSIANMAFNGCTAATSISLAEGLVTIGQQCFKNCAFSSVIIPSTVTTIKYDAFSLSALTTVTCKATTPPSCDSTTYKIFKTSGTITAIYVPAASVDTYKANQYWSPWASVIQAIPTT